MDDRLARSPQAIQAMFAGVAGRYDTLNRVLSLRRDVAWRRRLVAALRQAPPGPVLDLACGTGDVALGIGDREVVGADFCLDMLVLADRKARARRRAVRLATADALALPFPKGCFAGVAVAFGVRNFADLDAGLAEIVRVLAPGGLLAILEFQRPRGRVMAALSGAWNRLVVTPVGRAVSGDGEAYAYLPASVATFPDGRELSQRMAAVGFLGVESRAMSGGIVALSVGRRREGE
jgi:demethylmenaquinone methyltransferase/2-methoxy-6-polyprenyl-1,4-benzoquinol methylase